MAVAVSHVLSVLAPLGSRDFRILNDSEYLNKNVRSCAARLRFVSDVSKDQKQQKNKESLGCVTTYNAGGCSAIQAKFFRDSWVKKQDTRILFSLFYFFAMLCGNIPLKSCENGGTKCTGDGKDSWPGREAFLEEVHCNCTFLFTLKSHDDAFHDGEECDGLGCVVTYASKEEAQQQKLT